MPLMQLLANVCDLPVVLPHSHSTAVVLGSAILARCAAEQSAQKSVSVERLWKIMVNMILTTFLSFSLFSAVVCSDVLSRLR
jgi:ribulose kinase